MAKSKIIKQFARGEIDTEIALRQLKILLAEFPDKKLIAWVDKELTGYERTDEIPPYRRAVGSLKGSIINYGIHASNIGIPLHPDAPKNLRDFCNSVTFYESIGALKQLTIKQNDTIGIVVPPDYYPAIMKYSLITMTALLNAQVIVGNSDVFQILSEVNNKLLDIFLLLEHEFGVLDDLDIDLDVKTDNDINIIQNQINFYIYNDNRVTIGNENEITNSVISVDSDVKQ